MITIPFEVVRRQGIFHARADGLAKLFPDRFESAKTGDYLVPKDKRYGTGSNRGKESAVAFERFFRTSFGYGTKLQRTSPNPHAGRVDWLLHIRS